jgi:hypothetical protein
MHIGDLLDDAGLTTDVGKGEWSGGTETLFCEAGLRGLFLEGSTAIGDIGSFSLFSWDLSQSLKWTFMT